MKIKFKFKWLQPLATLGLLSYCQAALAEFEPQQTGDSQWGLTIVSTYQDSNVDWAKSEGLYSIDLSYSHQFNEVGFYAWWEYSKRTKADGISAFFEQANGDAATITDSNGQFSEWYLFGPLDAQGEPQWRVGINEVTTLIDRSEFANDEVEQFLSLGLVNNLTIGFSDYALSGFYQDLTAFDDIGYRVVLSSSHGFAQNNSGSYRELLDITGQGKGFFTAVEVVYRSSEYLANLGIWHNSADDVPADYGTYLSLDLLEAGVNFRYGYADAQPDNAEHFSALAWRKALALDEIAVGYTYTRYNRFIEPNVHQAEFYYRWNVTEQVYLTPSLQYSNDKSIADHSQWIFSVRTELSF